MTVGRNCFGACLLMVIGAGCGGGSGAGAGADGGNVKQPAPGTCTMTFSGGVTQAEDCSAYIQGETSGSVPSVAWVVDQGGMFRFNLNGIKEPYPGTYTTGNTNASTVRTAYGYAPFADQKQWAVNVNGGHIGPDQGDFSLQFASVAPRLAGGVEMLQGTFDATCPPDPFASATTGILKIHAVF